MQNVLFTGVTGLVGSAVAASILKNHKDIAITALVRRLPKQNSAKRVKTILDEQFEFDDSDIDFSLESEAFKRLTVIEGDIALESVVELAPKLRHIDTVFHCAADVNLGKDPAGKTYATNFNGSSNILKLAESIPSVKAFHYVSTAYTAGRSKGPVMEDGLRAEPEFNNSYEKSKYASEKMIRSHGLPFTIYRPSIVVGRLSDGKIRKPLAFYMVLDFLGKLKRHIAAKADRDPAAWMDMPLRMLSKPSDHIYFAPIDFIQNSILRLFPLPVQNKCYHLTGAKPISTKLIEAGVGRAIRAKGIAVVPEVPNPTHDEKMVIKFLGDFLPYFATEAEFDQTNVSKALGPEAVNWEITEDKLVEMLRMFFIQNSPHAPWLRHI
jgi:nucleoside-diphosphate-sugar epimerase